MVALLDPGLLVKDRHAAATAAASSCQVSLGGLVHALTPLAASNPAIHAFDGAGSAVAVTWKCLPRSFRWQAKNCWLLHVLDELMANMELPLPLQDLHSF